MIEADSSPIPKSFPLCSDDRGHGVGLCQIGAALMAARDYRYQQIPAQYYPGATLHPLYD